MATVTYSEPNNIDQVHYRILAYREIQPYRMLLSIKRLLLDQIHKILIF